ncbi:MAG: RNA-directed DNA polymerase [Candidatus Helarchaeota archaeon]
MKLNPESIEWAIEHLFLESDTDVFPKPLELDIIYKIKNDVIEKLEQIDIGAYNWNPARRFIIPKTDISFRIITQLDPIDNIIFSGIIYEYGNLIEKKRIPKNKNKVFSYRFSPQKDGKLYDITNSWKNFWDSCLGQSKKHKFVMYCDIADFYNQVYHHSIENMLDSCGFQTEIKNAIMRLIKSITQNISRGIPIGPHSFHLIAEMVLIPIDESLELRQIEFCRYMDDYVFFLTNKMNLEKLFFNLLKY